VAPSLPMGLQLAAFTGTGARPHCVIAAAAAQQEQQRQQQQPCQP
jgi:hypothetical protein